MGLILHREACIFVLYLKKLNHKGRKRLCGRLAWCVGPVGMGGLSQPWWEAERRTPCCFFPRTLVDDLSGTYMLHESLSPRARWWGHTGPAMGSVSGKNVHLSHELLTNFKANSTTLILRGNKYTAYGCPPWSILRISLFRKQSLLSGDYKSVPFLPRQWWLSKQLRVSGTSP